jgi:hypothetical protein
VGHGDALPAVVARLEDGAVGGRVRRDPGEGLLMDMAWTSWSYWRTRASFDATLGSLKTAMSAVLRSAKR